MKNSKFIQSSKDMLSRSFNPSKCKTSLRLAGSRSKLLRNRKEVQLKQMKREMAQLLESGQDRTARIRVEHVIREEKMMAAYELIEIYCELIIARLPIIESQKNCPIDLKEAIASIVFASPRCGDVPELLDVRKHFTAKYGKDFTTAAIELRPACGVSRLLVEKLSASAPDVQTKIKILSAIAEEHNVKWDHKSFEEKDSSGPSTFGSASQPYVEPSRYSQDVQAPTSNPMRSQSNYSYQDTKTSLQTDNFTPAQGLSSSISSQHKESPPNRQSWPMEFKDATSAAQAAAESAERASMAAKAAAELASGGRIMRQSSNESCKSEIYVSKDEGPESYLNSKKTNERTSIQSEQIDGINANHMKTAENLKEDGFGDKKEYNQSVSLKSKILIEEDLLDQGVSVVDGFSKENSLEEDSRCEISMKKQSFKQEAESANGWPDKSETVERISKQPSVKSSRSNSSVSDDLNIFANSEHPKFDYDADNDHFVKGDVRGEDSASVHFDDKFDSDGEDHGFDIGTKCNERESEFHFPSPSLKSTDHSSINRDSWVPESISSKTVESSPSLLFNTKYSSTEFSENWTSINHLEQDNFKPVAFDDSDGPISESDEEISVFKRTGITDTSDLLSKHNRTGKFKDEYGSSFEGKGYSGFQKEHLSLSSDDECECMHTSQDKSSYADSLKEFSLKKSSAELVEPNDFSEELHTDSGVGLNFEKLTGGLRHKSYNLPLYSKNQLDGLSPPKEAKPTVHSSVESPKISKMVDNKNKTRTTAPESDSDSDRSGEVSLRKSSGPKVKIQELGAGKEIKPNLGVGLSTSIFGSDSSDLDDEDGPKEPLSRKTHLRAGISRRTKASSRSSGTSTYSKTRLRSEALDSDDDMDRKPKTSYIPEEEEVESLNKQEAYDQPASAKLNSKTRLRSEALDSDDDVDRKPISDIPEEFEPKNKQGTCELPASVKVASKPARSNFWGPPEPYSSKTSTTKQESKAQVRNEEHDYADAIGERKPENASLKTEQEAASKPNNSNSSAVQESSNASILTESPKAETPNKTDSKDDGSKRASHVHPKLPDYDSLLQSLRINRS